MCLYFILIKVDFIFFIGGKKNIMEVLYLNNVLDIVLCG